MFDPPDSDLAPYADFDTADFVRRIYCSGALRSRAREEPRRGDPAI